jgi:hypothetical protein
MRFRPGRPFRRPAELLAEINRARRLGPSLFGQRGAGGRGPVAAELFAELGRAHRLLAEGHPAEAAPIFAELGRQAEALSLPQRAAHLHLQAARCYFQIRDSTTGLSHARLGLQTIINAGLQAKASNIYARLLAGLRANGLDAEAETLQKEFGVQLGGVTANPAATSPARAESQPEGQLPAKCPSCNGPIRSDEVDWIDAQSAECPYCGSTLHTE